MEYVDVVLASNNYEYVQVSVVSMSDT